MRLVQERAGADRGVVHRRIGRRRHRRPLESRGLRQRGGTAELVDEEPRHVGQRVALHVGRAADLGPGAAGSNHDGDVLRTIDRVADRSRDDPRLHGSGPELGAAIGVERSELTGARALKHEAAGGRQSAAVCRPRTLGAPGLTLRDGIPGDQAAVGPGHHVVGVERGVAAEIHAEIIG